MYKTWGLLFSSFTIFSTFVFLRNGKIGKDTTYLFFKVLTVGELYGKQLLQIPGVAAEKVVGIMEHYPTLREYVQFHLYSFIYSVIQSLPPLAIALKRGTFPSENSHHGY